MRMRLVPVSCGSYIILTFKKTSVADTNLLQSYLKVLLKKDRIKKVPAVETALWHLIIIVVIIMKEGIVARVVRIAKIRSTDRKSTRLNSSHIEESRMPSSA